MFYGMNAFPVFLRRLPAVRTLLTVLFSGILLPEAVYAALPSDTAVSYEQVIARRLDSLLRDDIFERTQVGLYVYDLTADRPLFARGARQLMRPASCQKIVTAVAALARLGTDYNYSTSLYMDGSEQDSILTGHLTVRAGFDPLFGRDDMLAFVHTVADRGIRRINGDIRLDVSIKDTTRMGWGWCWDNDTRPLTPLLYGGRDRFVKAFSQALEEAGITLDGNFVTALLPDTARLLITRRHTIDQILLPMMKKSDNLFAESLFYQIGAQSGRAYADRKRAAHSINSLIEHIGLPSSHYQIADGSGLSLYNYLTPELLVALLRYAYRHEEIYLHLHPSLPIAGEDGSLHRRMRGTSAAGNVAAKTGTVEGVSTLAGYATAPDGHLLCFAIMNQGLRHTSTGRNFQNRVCVALTTPENHGAEATAEEEPDLEENTEEPELEEKTDTP